MGDVVYLHVGCANKYYEGFVNSDSSLGWKGRIYRLDLQMDMSKPWPYKDSTVDGIAGVAVFQQLLWRDLVFAFREAYRVLKEGKILRIGVPFLDNGNTIDYLLGWNNTNLLSYELLEGVLTKHVGFSKCRLQNYKVSDDMKLAELDNRPEQLFYVEATK